MCLFHYYTQKPNALRLLVLFFLSAILCSFFNYDSPTMDRSLYDSYVWLSMGYDWLNGYIPYVDNFDHKGPLQILINAFALSFGLRMWGIVILATITTTFIGEVAYQCGRLLNTPKQFNYLGIITAILILGHYYNNTEVWSMPFQMLPLYLCLRYLRGDNKNVIIPALISGVCFGAVAMIRLNNDFVVAGVCITLCIMLIRQKEWKKLAQCAVCFLIGLCVAVLPFIIYFASHDALDEMIYCTFTFNFLYASEWNSVTLGGLFVHGYHLFPCVLLPFLCWYHDKYHKELPTTLLYSVMGLLLIACLIRGKNYGHYYILALPIYVACVHLAYVLPKKLCYIFLFLLLIHPCISMGKCLIDVLKYTTLSTDMDRHSGTAQYANLISDNIPQEDLDSIYVSTLPAQFFLALTEQGHHPVGRYSFLQPEYASKITGAKELILEHFEKANPKWIIMKDDEEYFELYAPYLKSYKEINKIHILTGFKGEMIDTFIIYRRKPIGE